MAAPHPFPHRIPLSRDFRHLRGVLDIPVAVQIVAIRIEPHTASSDAVWIAERQDFPDNIRVIPQQTAHRALACPGAARLPTVLSKHQPDRLLFAV
jgi:hypothetical protein